MQHEIQKTRFSRGDLMVVKTFDGRNARVWSLTDNIEVGVDVVDSLEAGDVCLCISQSSYFNDYVIILTHNGLLGYVQEDSLIHA